MNVKTIGADVFESNCSRNLSDNLADFDATL